MIEYTMDPTLNIVGNISAHDVALSSELHSKPIRKKDQLDDEYSEDNQLDLSQGPGDQSESSVDLSVVEARAKAELASFLSNKNVDMTLIDNYNIHLKRIKNKKGRESSSGLGYSVTYTTQDGSILISKTDVLNDIMHTMSKKSKNGNVPHDHVSREKLYEAARAHYDQLMDEKSFPLTIGDIKLIDIGRIDKRTPFHNSVQIYPVGYKCEQVVSTNSVARGIRETSLWCEIVDVDGDPEFLITVKSTGQTYLAPTEEEVWKKFDPTNVDKNWNPSFFNLDIELLIEGLEGSIDCLQYLYHAERGYGVSYFHNDQSSAAKRAYFLKTGRERRNKSRQKQYLENLEDIDAESNKKLSGDGKDRALREKEEAQKRKAAIREAIKEEKDMIRKQELALREKQKIEEKEQKEKMKIEDKVRQQLRKDVKIEVKRSQADASQLLLDFFDAEEDMIEQSQRKNVDSETSDSNILSSYDNLDAIIESSVDFCIRESCDEMPSLVLHVCNLLHVFRNRLNLNVSVDIDSFVSNLQAISGERSHQSNEIVAKAEAVIPSAQEEDNSTFGDPLNEAPRSTTSTALADAELLFDRIQLCLCYSLRESVIEVLDINEIPGAESNKREKQAFPVTLPLNQLTWMEVARMSLIYFLYSELGKGKEDIQGAIRGGKHTNLKATSKSVIKYIRNKIAKRALKGLHSNSNQNGRNVLNYELAEDDYLLSQNGNSTLTPCTEVSITNAFNTEEEIIQTLSSLSPSEYPESYLRCARVFLKVFGTAQAKNLVWEVDREVYFDYYQSIKFPMAFVNVATAILNKSYDGSATSSDSTVYNSFYRDMRQVIINCASFNTESTYLFIQAQKLIHVLFRHMQRWIWSSSCTSYTFCDEQHCVWSHELISSNLKSIKCDRCLGIFSLDFLFHDESVLLSEDDQSLFDDTFLPSQNQIDQSHEEWFCPFCLREDSIDVPWQKFIINEWGTSSSIPWLFHEKFSTISESISAEYSFLLPAWEAFLVLSDPSLNSICGISSANTSNNWSSIHRAKVLAGLCDALRSNSSGIDYLQKLASECEKLLRISSKPNFREADFMNVVKEVIGETDVSIYRSYLDGIDSREKDLQNRVIEGRCVICKGSTYEEDIGPEVEVLLCDGCDAEVHLHCLNLERVPSNEWHCPSCTDRLAMRQSKAEHALVNLDEHRNRELEEELLNQLISLKSTKAEDVERQGESSINKVNEKFCVYCGMNELDICSPFVVGQTRDEHDIYVKGFQSPVANGLFPGLKNTKVIFQIDGYVEDPPLVELPYFPLIEEENGKQLCDEIRSVGKEPLIVHEMCAIQMFQARLDRSRHTLRRRRKLIGDQVIASAGFNTIALGYDSSGRSYWKFPISDDLFVCLRKPVVKEKQEFGIKFGKNYASNDNGIATSQSVWKRITDTHVIRGIVASLANEESCDLLRQNIINCVLTKRQLTIPKTSSNVPADSNDDSAGNDVSDTESSRDDSKSDYEKPNSKSDARRESTRSSQSLETTPCALKLLKDKGFDILPSYEIAEEAVFEDVIAVFDDEDEGYTHREYFSYTRNKYFAIAIVNHQDKKLKYPKGALTVTYQIHREGLAAPLAYTPLNEQWSDNIYYFSTVTFKRSGTYTISFIVEGVDFASKIEPLVFSVNVRALYTLRGPKHALEQLNASKFIQASGRQIVHHRKELTLLTTKYENAVIENEFAATKTALFMFYAALPLGALQWEQSNDYNGQCHDDLKLYEAIVHSTGWNDFLDDVWRQNVESASNPSYLMECILVLEFFINRGWLMSPYHRLINSLALPHFAVKCVTTAAVALRIYCLDKAMMYDKVINVPRTTRRGPIDDQGDSRANLKTSKLNEVEASDVTSGRSRRQAYVEASSKIQNHSQNTSTQEKPKVFGKRRRGIDDEDVDDENYDESESITKESIDDNEESLSLKTKWRCASCKAMNESRARSCSECGERKLPGIVLQSSKSASSFEDEDMSVEKYSAPKSWKCGYCKAENEPRARSCQECGERKSVLVEKPVKRSVERSSSRLLRPALHRSYIDDDEEEFDEDVPPKKVTKLHQRKTITEDDEDVTHDQPQYIDFPEFDFDKEMENIESPITKKFLKIMNVLYHDNRSVDFWIPVDPVQVPSYRHVISNPMDLGTIAKYVLLDYYAGDKDLFAKDVRLVWDNCKVFNMDTSILYQHADELSTIFESLFTAEFN